jgi:hypothetical protein
MVWWTRWCHTRTCSRVMSTAFMAVWRLESLDFSLATIFVDRVSSKKKLSDNNKKNKAWKRNVKHLRITICKDDAVCVTYIYIRIIKIQKGGRIENESPLSSAKLGRRRWAGPRFGGRFRALRPRGRRRGAQQDGGQWTRGLVPYCSASNVTTSL